MKRFDARLRLGATFCLLAAVLFLVGWQGVHHLRQLDREMQNVIYDRLSEEQQVREAFHLSDLNSRLMLSIFLLDDPDEIKRLLVQRAANTERISELIRAIELRLNTAEEKRLLAAVEAARKPYIESYKQALAKLLDEHQRDEAQKMMVGVSLPRIAVYHDAWSAFTQCQVDKIEQGIKQSKADFAAAQRGLVFLVILACLITVALAVYVTFRVTREIAERQRAEEALQPVARPVGTTDPAAHRGTGKNQPSFASGNHRAQTHRGRTSCAGHSTRSGSQCHRDYRPQRHDSIGQPRFHGA